MELAANSAQNAAPAREKRDRKGRKGGILWVHTSLRPPADEGGDVCDVRWRSLQKCGFVYGTNEQTKTNKKPFNLYIFMPVFILILLVVNPHQNLFRAE